MSERVLLSSATLCKTEREKQFGNKTLRFKKNSEHMSVENHLQVTHVLMLTNYDFPILL